MPYNLDLHAVKTSEPIPTTEDLLSRVDALVPHIRERAPETAKLTSLPKVAVAEMKAAGLHHIQQPRRFGGYGYSQTLFVDVVEKIAAECGSSAWVYAVLAAHQRLLAGYPDEVQKAIWDETPDSVASSAFAPTGDAIRVAGGYCLSGRWPYSSGCDFAQWALLGGKLAGEVRPLTFVVQMKDLEILDDWHSTGLKATGSKTLVGRNIFVSDAFARTTPLFEGSTAPVGLVSVAIGCARGAIRTFIELYGEKIQPIRGGRMLDSEAIQDKLALSMADVDAASLLIHRDIQDTDTALARHNAIPIEIQSRNRRNQAYAGRLALQAIDRLFAVAGSTATAEGNQLQIKYRDVQTATLHASMSWDLAARQSIRMLHDPAFTPAF
ncbi:acyl-CoA dehydrogenase family protein [Novosphingobium sp. AAP83]|uniref:acyl-CoA dehydrogenase family protein n=1 Tax=Novosphingobium sp. AAP83 TaxID=1523425 RepID=UPI0006B8D56A|nr:acyl-CoA dehydrogenase family protein [Novosphingobium sp. AAP83]